MKSNSFLAQDGTEIFWRETGEGRPLVLIHGYFSEADTNWIKFGHADLLAKNGYRVIMPDLRAHGRSGKPHDPAHYPKDILADDQFALLAQLAHSDFDLGGYSLGGRTVARRWPPANPLATTLAGQQPTTNNQQPATNNQLPTTNN